VSEPVARRLTVHGRVQGVNFRAWVREQAVARGVDGWAGNQDDGSVDVWLQGDPDAVASVERTVAQGPAHARVARVDAEDVAAREDVRGFGRR
jgi:acylphosphatase